MAGAAAVAAAGSAAAAGASSQLPYLSSILLVGELNVKLCNYMRSIVLYNELSYWAPVE